MSNNRVATRNALSPRWAAIYAAQNRQERARIEAARSALFNPYGPGKAEPVDPRRIEASARAYWLETMGYDPE